MKLAPVPLTPVDPAQVHVLRIAAAINGLMLLGAAVAIETYVPGLPFRGVAVAAVLLFCAWHVGLAPRRRWARLGYAFTGNELHVRQGLVTRHYTVVPTSRVQHVDISEGYFERLFGVATLVMHTAGTNLSAVALPGLSRGDAEEIRDTIRERIGSALA